MALDARRARHAFQFVEHGPSAADDEPGVGVQPDDLVHRFDDEALAGERMEPLDVEQQVRVLDAERRPRRRLRVFVVEREAVVHRRIDGLHPPPRESQLLRADHQAVAVERDGCGGLIGAREQIGTGFLRRVVPDLGAVERQHDRLPHAAAEQDGQFGEQTVAVDVDDVRARDARREQPPDAARRERRGELERSRERAAARSGHPGDRTGERRVSSGARWMRDVLDVRSFVARPVPELPGQQRIRGLVRRQVRRDVEDVHQAADTYVPRNSANVAGTARSSRVANARNRSRRSKKASSSASVRL